MKNIFGALMIFMASVVFAAEETIEFTWEAPTTREDGQVLPIEEIDKYTIYFENGDVLADITGGGSTQYVQDLILDGGETVCFQITAWSRGLESVKSPIDPENHCKTAPYSSPSVPTEFRAVFNLGVDNE